MSYNLILFYLSSDNISLMLLSMGMNAVHFQPNHGSETEVGLQSELCELALTALAEWSGQLNPKGGTTLASHDFVSLQSIGHALSGDLQI